MEAVRRIAVALAVFVLAAVVFASLRGEGSYGALDVLLRRSPTTVEIVGEGPAVAPGYTPAAVLPVTENDVPLLTQLDAEFALLAERTIPSVVSISTVRSGNIHYLNPFGFHQRSEKFQQPGLGSGVIVSAEGHVITNHHVVDGVDGIRVTTHEGTAYRASIIGSDPVLDIAILKIDAEHIPFPALPFGDSDKVKVGQSIFAVGNPFGLSSTVTRGIVSAKERSLSDTAPDLIQTDAVINPGNSGGPVLNVRGEIVGINVAIYKGQEGVEIWQGIGLAIPSNSVNDAFTTIMTRGRPIFGYLGVSVGREVVSGGVAITAVSEHSPAAEAQLALGDRILEFDGKKVSGAEEFLRRVLRSPIGESVDLLVLRGAETVLLQPVIGERPTEPQMVEPGASEAAVAAIVRALGLRCRDLTGTERMRAGTFPDSPGVYISAVDPMSPFARRLAKGDLVQQINQIPVGSVTALSEALNLLPSEQPAIMFALSRGQRQEIRFVPHER